MNSLASDTCLEQDSFVFSPVEEKVEKAYFQRSFWKTFCSGLRANKLAVLCMVFLVIIVLASCCAGLCPYDPDATSMREKFLLPSAQHWFGTDHMGRDYFTRCLYGGRVSISVGIFSMVVSILIGTLYGSISGFAGGKTDAFMMRTLDVIMSIPSMLLIIIINSMVHTSMFTLVLIIGAFSWMGVARIVRAETLSVKERDYVTAARNLGVSGGGIILRHVIPNIGAPIIVASTINVARAILMESSLSYLGFGVQVPTASWGSMLQNAQSYILDRPLLAIYPGVLILLTVLSLNFLGDILRNILEPRLVK